MNERDVISPITVSSGVAVLVPLCTTHNVDHRRATGHPTHLRTSYPFHTPTLDCLMSQQHAKYISVMNLLTKCLLAAKTEVADQICYQTHSLYTGNGLM